MSLEDQPTQATLRFALEMIADVPCLGRSLGTQKEGLQRICFDGYKQCYNDVIWCSMRLEVFF